jgi:hypothetical protein
MDDIDVSKLNEAQHGMQEEAPAATLTTPDDPGAVYG